SVGLPGAGIRHPSPTLDAVTWEGTGPHREVFSLIEEQANHRDVEVALLAAGWTPCGAGDWAIALRSPDGAAAARISPFDPTGPYAAALYREAAHTRQVPELYAHCRLTGGGDLQVLEWLQSVPLDEAEAFYRAIATRALEVADL